ncbi:MAG TPA: DUF6498-containing protein [Gemmatimonadaceae bacterium]|nr:DUF6498-containing protein [Gemmatimonadaceae bacterium]
MPTETNTETWTSSWPDAVAFAIGLAVAWWTRWSAGDLVWSLWLSSFVVGYATILWMIIQPAGEFCRVAWRDRAVFSGNPRALIAFVTLLIIGVSFFLGFFTIHFGGFHYVHSQILISFFPIDTGHGRPTNATMATYVEIARRYWPFLPSAFIAHRAAFMRKPFSLDPQTPLAGMTDNRKFGQLFSEPYRNVIRMHTLIFFFFFAHFAKLENFAVYAVIYAVYFFPWRLVRRGSSQAIELQQPAAVVQRASLRSALQNRNTPASTSA